MSSPTPPASGDGPVLHSRPQLAPTITTGEDDLPRVAAEPIILAPLSPSTRTSDRYTLSRLHASGGIGQVWLARDADLGRDVALKELRAETILNSRARARFLEEARITGQLEHPGIVPVYELATLPGSGQVFYTMRFVKGRTLTEAIADYHRKRKAAKAGPLDLASLLQAFVAVCNAVAYAHSRGVIHRDLKGQNVVLGDFGEVIVLDWGLAKLVQQQESKEEARPVAVPADRNRDGTMQGQVLGTPAYMAPEQAAGRLDLIDARTDVYGLGAILYEILTGSPPFTGTTVDEVVQKVQHEPPVRPRHVVSEVAPALEAVCLRALEKKPEDRYPKATELAREIQRWLADEPVRAYREPLPVRLGRWGRKHRTAVAGTVALLLTAIVALATSNWLISLEQQRTKAAQEKAEANFARARDAVDRYFTQISTHRLLNERGLQPLRKELLLTAREFYQQFVTEHQDDPTLQAERGKALIQLARITAAIDSKQEAGGLFQQALDVFAPLAAEHPEVPEHRHQLAICHNNLGTLKWEGGHSEEAETAYHQAIALWQELVDSSTAVPEYGRQLALAHNNLGALLRDRGRMKEAIAEYQEALPMQRKLCAADPHFAACQCDLAGTCNNLGILHCDNNQLDLSEKAFGEALALRQALVKEHPEAIEYRNDLASSWNNLGNLHWQARRMPQAGAAFQTALEMRAGIARENPTVTQYQTDLANVFNNLGNWQHVNDQLEQADGSYHKALEIWSRLVEAHPEVEDFTIGLGWIRYHLGWLEGDRHKDELACDWYTQAIQTLEKVSHPERPKVHRVLRDSYWGRAQMQDRLHKHREAAADWDQAMKHEDGPPREEFILGLGQSLARVGEHEEAADTINALALKSSLAPDTLYELAVVYSLASDAAGKDVLFAQGERATRANTLAGRAVELLCHARAAGFFTAPAQRRRLQLDHDLDALRSREDFGKFLNEMGSADARR